MLKATVVALGVLIIGYEAGHGAVALAAAEGAAPGTDRSEFHFVLSFPLGAMNGFASHPATPGDGCLNPGTAPYTSAIFGLGLSLGLLYETEWFGVGAQVSGFLGDAGASTFGDVYGLVYLSSGSVSPFIGAGVGFLGNSVLLLCPPSPPPDGFGAMTEVQLGMEFGRLSPDHVRVQLSFEVLIPLYSDDDGSYPVGMLLNTRVAF